jgi:uroporphyrinogen decarboxylase
VVTTIVEMAWTLRGYEEMMVDFAADPERAEAILDIPFRHHLVAAERLARMGVDWVWLGDDVGAHHAMLISSAAWSRSLMPHPEGRLPLGRVHSSHDRLTA